MTESSISSLIVHDDDDRNAMDMCIWTSVDRASSVVKSVRAIGNLLCFALRRHFLADL